MNIVQELLVTVRPECAHVVVHDPPADDHGAVVHGIDASLLEGMQYDADGQPLTVTFAD